MKRFLALALVAAMIGLGVPMPATAGIGGQISGTALTSDMQALRSSTVRLRSLATGVVRDTAMLGAQGSFLFGGLAPGSYMVEVVNNGQVVGTSGELSITPKAPVVAGVTVMARSQDAQAPSTKKGFFANTGAVVTLVAVGAGVTAGIIVGTRDSSPSK